MHQVFAHNRNEINAFAAELVFRDVPGEFLQRGWDPEGFGVSSGRRVALIDAVAGGVAGVSLSPVCLCLLTADCLAFRFAAGALAIAYPWVWVEPPQTIPAGALPQSGHPLLSACYRVVNFSLAGVGKFSLAPKVGFPLWQTLPFALFTTALLYTL